MKTIIILIVIVLFALGIMSLMKMSGISERRQEELNTPKKPVERVYPVMYLIGEKKLYQTIYECPHCKAQVTNNQEYCDWCAQRISWEEVE